MNFDWGLALPSLIGGLTLLIGANLSRRYEKTFFAPATAMLLTWSAALLALSFLPLINFYHLSAKAVILYVLGAIWFATIAILTSWILSKHSKQNHHPPSISANDINYNHLLIFWAIIAAFAYPIALFKIISFGSNITEIAYNIRIAAVSGQSILPPLVSNTFLLLGVLANLVFFGVVQKKIKLTRFIFLAAPLLAISLIIDGRSSLVSLIIGWFAIIAIFSKNFKIRDIALPSLTLLSIIFFGGVWVQKFDLEGQSTKDAFAILANHLFGYLYQGPVLFSLYYTDAIDITTKWDFLNSACHLFSKIDICTPLPLHQSFSQYGTGLDGNVYSIYYSIIPNYGLLGLVLVFAIYAIFTSLLFKMFKSFKLFAIASYPIIFSAIILSVFKDGIGYSFYWLLKVLIICTFIRIFSQRKIKIQSFNPKHKEMI